jgi:hypothetical protein
MKIGYKFDKNLYNFNKNLYKNKIDEITKKILLELDNKDEIFIISYTDIKKILKKYFLQIYKRIPRKNFYINDKNLSPTQIISELELDNYYQPNLIKIITYNVCWENMKSRRNKRGIIHNEECLKPDLCAKNISKFILDKLPLDFILIQEAAQIETLISTIPKSYFLTFYVSGLETILTIINNSYKIINSLGGEFEKGRPFLCSFLSNNICLINVHMGHKQIFLNDMKIIEQLLFKYNYTHKFFDSYRIIIGGDFNQKLDSEYKFMGKTIYKNISNPTYGLKTNHNGTSIDELKISSLKDSDHVFDSENNIIYSMNLTPIDSQKKIVASSDHFAIYAELSK